jgi:signal transduction histidine kinase
MMLTVVALADFLTGYEMFFFVFYLLAIVPAAWFVGFLYGTLIAALSVTAWVSTSVAGGEHFSNYFIPVWNALIMFVFYLVVLGLLWRLKRFHNELEERVRVRTEALAREVQERMRLQRELLETSEREQRRIGRELHDGLCQHLTGMSLASHSLSRRLSKAAPMEEAAANQLVNLMEGAIEMTRSLSRGLNPVEVEVGRLADNFRELAESVSARAKVDCRFESVGGTPKLEVLVATHLYRIAQEAIANAVEHGGAKRVDVRLTNVDDEVVLTVMDNGAGVAENFKEQDGLGWQLMKYRADLIGAVFNLGQGSNSGMRMTCTLPHGNGTEATI